MTQENLAKINLEFEKITPVKESDMNPNVRQAGLDSIAHWKRMRDDPSCEEEPTAENCPLCRVLGDTCVGCPILRKTALYGCGGTPYFLARCAWGSWKNTGSFITGPSYDRWQAAATEEIKFLEGIFVEEIEDGK